MIPMLHLDLKYIHLLASQFERFTRKGDYLFNVRCPICGDSQSRKTKMRGYIYRVKQSMAFKCHNCNVGMSFGNLLKELHPELHKEYILEWIRDNNGRTQKPIITPRTISHEQFRFDTVEQVHYQHAERVSDLPDGHFCLEYVKNRLIPKDFWNKLYFTSHFKDFVDEIVPDHGKEISNDSRLVIPFYDSYGAVVAVSGRALEGGAEALRYVTLRTIHTDIKLVYGLDRVDQSKPVLVVEGPLDSLFLPNAVASGDSNLIQTARRLSAANITLIFDNEPRNKEIVEQMGQAIKRGFSVAIWPEWMKEKDINKMVESGYTQQNLMDIITQHTYKGLTALTHFTHWKKV